MNAALVASDIYPGQELPTLERTVGFHNWNRYAAVNDEFVNIHMDDTAGQAAGYPSAFGMGNLQYAYLHILLHQWMGDAGRIVSLRCQFRAPVLKGAKVTARGVVTALRPQDDEVLVELEIWTENERGERLAPGGAVVALRHGASGGSTSGT
jgi:acyl dehydratase